MFVEDAASLPAQIAALKRGESVARAVRCPGGGLKAGALAAARKRMSSTVVRALARAKEKLPGADFDMSVGQFFTRRDDVVVCCAVTRTK